MRIPFRIFPARLPAPRYLVPPLVSVSIALGSALYGIRHPAEVYGWCILAALSLGVGLFTSGTLVLYYPPTLSPRWIECFIGLRVLGVILIIVGLYMHFMRVLL